MMSQILCNKFEKSGQYRKVNFSPNWERAVKVKRVLFYMGALFILH